VGLGLLGEVVGWGVCFGVGVFWGWWLWLFVLSPFVFFWSFVSFGVSSVGSGTVSFLAFTLWGCWLRVFLFVVGVSGGFLEFGGEFGWLLLLGLGGGGLGVGIRRRGGGAAACGLGGAGWVGWW